MFKVPFAVLHFQFSLCHIHDQTLTLAQALFHRLIFVAILSRLQIQQLLCQHQETSSSRLIYFSSIGVPINIFELQVLIDANS